MLFRSAETLPHPQTGFLQTGNQGGGHARITALSNTATSVQISSFTPQQGFSLGGELLTIYGSQFTSVPASDLQVLFDNQVASELTVVNDSTIQARVPAHAPGAVNVVLKVAGEELAFATPYTYYQQLDFTPTGNEQTFSVPQAGYYRFEAWGAAGAGTGDLAGRGGYTSGIVYLQKDQVIYLHTGSQGQVGSSGQTTGGYNGGGATGAYGSETMEIGRASCRERV